MAMAATTHGQTPPKLRNVQIREGEKETIFWLAMAPHEQVLVAYTDGSGMPAYPLRGIVFQADTEKIRLRLEVATPEASRDGQWRLMWGVQDNEHFTAAGGPIRPRPENEQRIPVRHLQVPVDVEGMEIHLFPFLVTKHRTGAMMVAIAKDRQIMRKNLRLLEIKDFDWDKSFEAAESFLPLRNTPEEPKKNLSGRES